MTPSASQRHPIPQLSFPIDRCLSIIIRMLALKQTGTLRQNSYFPINKQTDQLYQPLREALRKSTITKGFLSQDTRSSFQRSSASNRKMHLLTPTEAENIKNGIFIPVNKALVPTRNIQKVLGKQFTPVDMSQKVGEPLTPEQFNLKRQGGISEIVYEIKEEDNPYQLYTSRTNLPPASPRISKQFASSAVIDPRPRHSPVEELPKPLFLSHSSKDLVPGKHMSISLASPPSDSSKPTTPFSPRKYQFKQSLRGSETRQINGGQDEYRYNLFSVVDEGCNSSCHRGCCADNEIIASKVQGRGWS